MDIPWIFGRLGSACLSCTRGNSCLPGATTMTCSNSLWITRLCCFPRPYWNGAEFSARQQGAPNKRFLKKGQFYDQHFEEEKGQVVFKWLTQDKVTKAEIIDKKIYDKPVKSIYEQLRKVRSSSDDAKKVSILSLFALVLS